MKINLDFTGKILKALLCPIARIALRHGWKIQELLEALKESLIHVAQEELANKNAEVSISRLSIMTGLQRRDVSRIIELRPHSSEKTSTLVKIIGLWQQDPRFSLKGKPLPLDIEGKESGFNKLVNSVSKDLNPYAALFELERVGLICRDVNSAFLKSEVFEYRKNTDEGLILAAEDLNDLLLAVEDNLYGCKEIPNLHIKTYYDNIPVRFIDEIKEWFLLKGSELHREARDFLSKFDRDLNPKFFKEKGRARVALGSFSCVSIIDNNKNT